MFGAPLHKRTAVAVLTAAVLVGGCTRGANEVETGAAAPVGSGVFALGHSAVRVGAGTVFLGLDAVYALLGRALQRGEQVEADARHAASSLRRRTSDTAHGAVSGVSRRASATVSTGLSSVLNVLPGVNLAYKAPAGASLPDAGGGKSEPGAQV